MIDYNTLTKPFEPTDIEWFVGVTTQDKSKGLAIPFITARAVQTRLDEACGPGNWQNEYIEWKNEAQLSKISIWDNEKQQWISKTDGSGDTDIESIKGGLSQSFKRCATMWGIGRYLYSLESPWVEIEQRGKSWVIKANQKLVLPAWAMPGGSGTPGTTDSRQVTVEILGQGGQQFAPQGQSTPQGQSAPSPQSGGGQPTKTLSDAQVNRALKKANVANMTIDDVLLWIDKKFGAKAIKELNRQQYDELCDALDKAANGTN